MKKIILIFCLSFIGFSCEKDNHEDHNHSEVCQMCTDTDGDELNDFIEINTYTTNPTNDDTDDDGLGDGEEINEYSTDPKDPDSDNDGLEDGEEIDIGTNPNNWDTDGGGVGDGVEWESE